MIRNLSSPQTALFIPFRAVVAPTDYIYHENTVLQMLCDVFIDAIIMKKMIQKMLWKWVIMTKSKIVEKNADGLQGRY